MHSLAQRVLSHIHRQELLRAGERVGVAVSGGIDSVALLRVLLELRGELGIVLSVVHFNHGLRGAEADGDEKFVAGLARELGLEFFGERGDVERVAAEGHSGVEAAARELRYGFFRRVLGVEPQRLKPASVEQLSGTTEVVPFPSHVSPNILDKIVTGHTADDQAETVLMRVIRGTGLRGLGGIYPRIVLQREDGVQAEIVRPLLGIRRRELETYLVELKQPWREDGSNADFRFTRNRLRGRVMPVLEREFNPAIVESLGELAEIARDEEDYWENEASGWLGTVVQWLEPEWARAGQGLLQIKPAWPGERSVQTSAGAGEQEVLRCAQDDKSAHDDKNAQGDSDIFTGGTVGKDDIGMSASVSRPWLVTEPLAVQRRVVKAIGEEAGIPLEFKHVEEILRFAAEGGPAGKELSLPLGWKVVRQAEAMVFVTPDWRRQERIPDYEYQLAIPGRVRVAELDCELEALLLPAGADLAEYNPQELLRADLLPERLTLRNWRAGDRFFPAHTKAPKKVKELLQERHVSGTGRRLWPVVTSDADDGIIWMRGFAVPAKLVAKPGEAAVLIRETHRIDDEV